MVGMPVSSTIHTEEIASMLGLGEFETALLPADRAVVGGDPDWADTQHRRTDEREGHTPIYQKPADRWHSIFKFSDLPLDMPTRNDQISSSDQTRPAVVLLSGGLDSTTVLAIAREAGYACHTIAFDYGQRHRNELDASAKISSALGAATHRVFPINIGAFGGSALTADIEVPKGRDESEMTEIPITYVPARNLVFLSIATALAETLDAKDIFLGVNAVDYSGYPDCRPEFIESFTTTANLATKMGVEGNGIRVHSPLMEMTKAEIVKRGVELGVDYSMTHSCYDPIEGKACGACDSCILRRRGFEHAGIVDPTLYAHQQGAS